MYDLNLYRSYQSGRIVFTTWKNKIVFMVIFVIWMHLKEMTCVCTMHKWSKNHLKSPLFVVVVFPDVGFSTSFLSIAWIIILKFESEDKGAIKKMQLATMLLTSKTRNRSTNLGERIHHRRSHCKSHTLRHWNPSYLSKNVVLAILRNE